MPPNTTTRKNADSDSESAESHGEPRSGIHVDVENLYLNAQFVIHDLISKWPQEKAPPPSHLNLYVTADQSELWRTWAESRFPTLRINILGTQRFSIAPTKNSADITLVLNAAMDLVTGKVNHIVLVSNDSDYIALHAAIRDHQNAPSKDGTTPFLWVMTDEEKRISRTVQQFFPSEQIHTILVPTEMRNSNNDNYPYPLPFNQAQTRVQQSPTEGLSIPEPQKHAGGDESRREQSENPTPNSTPTPTENHTGPDNGFGSKATNQNHARLREYQRLNRNQNGVHRMITGDNWDGIAETIMEHISTGGFTARDCRPLIRKYWPDHQMGYANPSQLGNEFRERIWPILERHGVIRKKGHKSGQYEMTNRAKNKVHELSRARDLIEAEYIIPVDIPAPANSVR